MTLDELNHTDNDEENQSKEHNTNAEENEPMEESDVSKHDFSVRKVSVS